MLKAVIDSNVFISGLLNPGIASAIIDWLKSDQFQVVYPEQLIVEIRRISTSKLAGRIRHDDLTELLELITNRGQLVAPEEIPAVCRDPSDDIYLACAVVANCDFLVTGDRDFHSINESKAIKIVTPAEFLSILKSGS